MLNCYVFMESKMILKALRRGAGKGGPSAPSVN